MQASTGEKDNLCKGYTLATDSERHTSRTRPHVAPKNEQEAVMIKRCSPESQPNNSSLAANLMRLVEMPNNRGLGRALATECATTPEIT